MHITAEFHITVHARKCHKSKVSICNQPKFAPFYAFLLPLMYFWNVIVMFFWQNWNLGIFTDRKLPPESEMKGLAIIKVRFLTFTSFFWKWQFVVIVSFVILHYKAVILNNWDMCVVCTRGTRKCWSAHKTLKNGGKIFWKGLWRSRKRP